MCSAQGLQTSLWRGCPIRNLRAHRLDAAPPERFAGLRVLHRPDAPRHPPRTLARLLLPPLVSERGGHRPTREACLRGDDGLISGLPLFFFSCLSKIEAIMYAVVQVRVAGVSSPHQLECGKPRNPCRLLSRLQVCSLPSRSTWEWLSPSRERSNAP
jgi:hypothetical protein